MPDRTRYHFPWRRGNRFTLLVDGDRFLPAMFEAIGAARESVLLEMYLFDSGTLAQRFVDAFRAAAERGVRVRLLLDDYGTNGLLKRERAALEAAGVQLVSYNPLRYFDFHGNLLRDHRKLLLVDGATAFVGGAGITDAFDPALRPDDYWRENMVQVEGPCVGDWHRAFAEVWSHWSELPLDVPAPEPAPLPDDRCGRVVLSNRGVHAEVKRSIVSHVRRAQERAWVATAYFIPSWKLRRALRKAASRGVDVRLLVPGALTDVPGVGHASRRYYGRLLRNGVRIFEYQPRFLHVKTVLCDDWASVGSSNVDRWNLRWNLDANQEISSPAFAAQVAEVFRDDFAASTEITWQAWRSRPLLQRIAEIFWGRIDLLLARIEQARELQHRRRERG